MQEQHGQERALLLPAQVERPPVLEHLERAEDAEVQRYFATGAVARASAPFMPSSR